LSHVESERDTAADWWKGDGVAAIGFGKTGDLRGLSGDRIRQLIEIHYPEKTLPGTRQRTPRTPISVDGARDDLLYFRDHVRPETLILAYQGRNLVALVGEVKEGYRYSASNRVGSPDAPWRDYQHQVKVDWWSKPSKFHRRHLSKTVLPELVSWVARRGTIFCKDFEDDQVETLKHQLREIPSDST